MSQSQKFVPAITEAEMMPESFETKLARRCGLFEAIVIHAARDGRLKDWELKSLKQELEKGFFESDKITLSSLNIHPNELS